MTVKISGADGDNSGIKNNKAAQIFFSLFQFLF